MSRYLIKHRIQVETTAHIAAEWKIRERQQDWNLDQIYVTCKESFCLWAEAMNTAVYILNRTPTSLSTKSTYEI